MKSKLWLCGPLLLGIGLYLIINALTLVSYQHIGRLVPVSYGLPDVPVGEMPEKERLEYNMKLARTRDEQKKQVEASFREEETRMRRKGVLYLVGALISLAMGVKLLRN